MKQVIWIVGTSSAGKQTFITRLTHDRDMQARFGLENKKIAILDRSVSFPGDATMPDIVKERELIPRDASELLRTDVGVVLIKWQYVDSLYLLPEKLEAGMFNANHRVIILESSREESIDRLACKEWWRAKGFNEATELYEHEQKLASDYIAEFEKKYKTTKLNSSSNAAYSEII